MKRSFAGLLAHPRSGKALTLVEFNVGKDSLGDESVMEGLLYEESSGHVFPILQGVPMMVDAACPPDFLARYSTQIESLRKDRLLDIRPDSSERFSFSTQWEQFYGDGVQRSWGYTIEERLEQILMETQVDAKWLRGKLVLDAGCGSGAIAEGIAKLGAEVVGIDYSSSVVAAEQRRTSPNIHFCQGDLLAPSLREGIFDLAISIGVLMCTPDTFAGFSEICRLVKPGGRFYVWVYRKPETFLRRHIKYPLYDLARHMITRMPKGLQGSIVKSYARAVKATHRLFSKADIPLSEYVFSAYDDLTPRWRRYHTPFELGEWFYRNGFTAPVLSHWDNPYGFGVVATKTPQNATPGIHYGNEPKLWDQKQTVLG